MNADNAVQRFTKHFPKSGLCWFCGLFSQACIPGMTLEAMIKNDFRISDPVEGEFALMPTPSESDYCLICQQCWSTAYAKVPDLAQEYLRQQRILREDSSVEDSDVGSGMIDVDEKTSLYGCWFGLYSISCESHVCWSMTLLELLLRGLKVSHEFRVTQRQIDIFISQFGCGGPLCDIDSGRCRYLRNVLSLCDGSEPSAECLMALLGCRACILDVTLQGRAEMGTGPF